ncbi:hypothetical protein PAPYR_6123 [Paratrimastix pyriformis]|uniref:BRCT domain-containing protein n=1 Tax=Paratrimastix pyriformis TaxID=342808 RepID=A0ABQ8UIA6_9EUKA|nr:hypothetical protein PAPYR_6123 [Paratrimastix pyriformis]
MAQSRLFAGLSCYFRGRGIHREAITKALKDHGGNVATKLSVEVTHVISKCLISLPCCSAIFVTQDWVTNSVTHNRLLPEKDFCPGSATVDEAEDESQEDEADVAQEDEADVETQEDEADVETQEDEIQESGRVTRARARARARVAALKAAEEKARAEDENSQSQATHRSADPELSLSALSPSTLKVPCSSPSGRNSLPIDIPALAQNILDLVKVDGGMPTPNDHTASVKHLHAWLDRNFSQFCPSQPVFTDAAFPAKWSYPGIHLKTGLSDAQLTVSGIAVFHSEVNSNKARLESLSQLLRYMYLSALGLFLRDFTGTLCAFYADPQVQLVIPLQMTVQQTTQMEVKVLLDARARALIRSSIACVHRTFYPDRLKPLEEGVLPIVPLTYLKPKKGAWSFVPKGHSPTGTITARSLLHSPEHGYAKLMAGSETGDTLRFLPGSRILTQWRVFDLPFQLVLMPSKGPTLFDLQRRGELLRYGTLLDFGRAIIRATRNLAQKFMVHADFRLPNLCVPTPPGEPIVVQPIDYERMFPLEVGVEMTRYMDSFDTPHAVRSAAGLALHCTALSMIRLSGVALPEGGEDHLIHMDYASLLPDAIKELVVQLVSPVSPAPPDPLEDVGDAHPEGQLPYYGYIGGAAVMARLRALVPD